jgi:hypothetical protein
MRALALIPLLLSPGGALAQSDPATGTPAAPAEIDPALLVEAPAVSAAPSAQEVGLGQVFYLFVRVVHQPGMQVNLPATLPLGPAFEESARTDVVRQEADGTVSREFEIALQAFEVGDLVIPPIPVTYAAYGRAQEVVTQAVPIQVTGAVGEGEAELRDIAGPVALERPDWTLLYVGAAVGGAISLLALVLIASRLWRRRRRRVGRLAEALRRPAHEEALARLDEVEASGALDAEDRKPAYLAMSEALRGYLGRRFGFPALDLTTEEIRRELAARHAGVELADSMCAWLEQGDLVKFAGHDASPDEARQALYEARIFIDRTRADVPAAAAPTQPAAAPHRAGQPAAPPPEEVR